jgi:hypothetical protein
MDKYGFKTFDLNPGSKTPAARGWQASASVEHVSKDNYGILLDGQFIVVDVDYPERLPKGFLDSIGPTWSQKTKRGFHYLYKVPDGFKGKNGKIANNAGDLKCNGYIVGPGSVVDGFKYEVFVPTEPEMAPQGLLDLCKDNRSESVSTDIGTEQNLQIKKDEGRNQFLTRVAGSLRGLGLGTEQVKKLVRHTNGTVCQPPLTESEIRNTIDKSIEKWERGEHDQIGSLLPANVLQADQISLIREPFDYMIRPLIPKVGLTLMHGAGSVGKSTFASFVTAQATRRKMRVFLLCSEEDVLLHIQRAIHMGADPSYINWPDPKKESVLDIKFPTNMDKVENIIKTLGIELLYIDSIKSHGDLAVFKNMHDGDKSRKLVEGVAALGIRFKIPILATFHNKKDSDTAMGSDELKNTARQQLSLTRTGSKEQKVLQIEVDKSNGPDEGRIVQFDWHSEFFIDPTTGEYQKEILRDDINADNYRETFAEETNQKIPFITVIPASKEVKGTKYVAPIRDATSLAIIDFLTISEEWVASAVLKSQILGKIETSTATIERALASLVEESAIKTEGNNRSTRYRIINTLIE